MDNYYAHDKEYSSLLETIKPWIENDVERTDFNVFGFNFDM
jgi:hypothetical protein